MQTLVIRAIPVAFIASQIWADISNVTFILRLLRCTTFRVCSCQVIKVCFPCCAVFRNSKTYIFGVVPCFDKTIVFRVLPFSFKLLPCNKMISVQWCWWHLYTSKHISSYQCTSVHISTHQYILVHIGTY